jgi:hypothetical protein
MTKNILGYSALLLASIIVATAIVSGNSNRKDISAKTIEANTLAHTVSSQQFAHSLAKKNDARSLLFASILIQSGSALIPKEQQNANEILSKQWLQSAITLGKNDALIAWVEATRCFGNKACNSDDAIERLKTLDPENAAVYLLVLNSIQASGDVSKADATFLKIVNSRYYNNYYHQYAKASHHSLSGWQLQRTASERKVDAILFGMEKIPSDEDYRKIQSLGIAMAFPFPGMQSLNTYCDNTKNQTARLEQCIKLYEMIRNDSTNISKFIALSKLSTLAVNHPQGAKFREELRQYYWLNEKQNKLIRTRSEYDSSHIQQWPNLTEWESLLIDMKKAGIPLLAPKSWLPNEQYKRDRVLSGVSAKR